jgi:hypothetical protein
MPRPRALPVGTAQAATVTVADWQWRRGAGASTPGAVLAHCAGRRVDGRDAGGARDILRVGRSDNKLNPAPGPPAAGRPAVRTHWQSYALSGSLRARSSSRPKAAKLALHSNTARYLSISASVAANETVGPADKIASHTPRLQRKRRW